MSLSGKIISIINILYFLGILYAVFMGGSILTVMFTIVGLLIFVLPLLMGLVNSILFYKKSRKSNYKWSIIEKVFVVVPIVNVLVVGCLIMALFLGS